MAGEPIRIDGFEQFYFLSKALKDAGDTELRNALNREVRNRVKPLVKRTRAVALETLPKSGGLAKSVARAPQRVVVRTGRSESGAGVRIVVGSRPGVAARMANQGEVRHPVFKTGKWVTQKVPAGWFDATLEHEAPPVVRRALEEACRDVLNGVVKRGAPRKQLGAAGWSQR